MGELERMHFRQPEVRILKLDGINQRDLIFPLIVDVMIMLSS